MKKFLSIFALGFVIALGNAHAADDRGACAKEAEGKPVAERRAFIKECVKTKASATADKTKACKAEGEASGKKEKELADLVKTCMTK